MKKSVLIALLLLLTLSAVLLTRTLLTGPIVFQKLAMQSPAEAGAAQAAQVLAASVRFETIAEKEASQMPTYQFRGFQQYLRVAFPRVHAKLTRETVAEHTLLYTWTGKRPDLPPVVLMGHYDVVPVSEKTRANWVEAPFSGTIKDGFVWGRGTLDDKLSVIAILQAAESLLASDFQPERTVYFVFGHDEEVLGTGAKAAADLLKARNVKPEFVLDEGGTVVSGAVPGVKAPVALIGIAEKGYLTLKLSARGTGGHSSMPPPNTAVGIVAAAVARLEEQPLPVRIDGAVSEFFRHVGPHMPPFLRMAVANLWLFRPIVSGQLANSRAGSATVRTTTAATVIAGGIKENVLPDESYALINFRLLPGDSPDSVHAAAVRIIDDKRVATERVTVSPASPISPTGTPSFQTLGRVVATVFPDAVVSPYLVVGATDSRHFAILTPNVYRFLPVRMASADLDRMHGVNERVSVEGVTEAVRFYALLLRQQ